jgi:hypothetical protein
VVLANGWADTKIAESVHELRERSSFSACRLEGQGQRRADLSPAWGRAFAPTVRRAKDFKLVPQEMPQSKM